MKLHGGEEGRHRNVNMHLIIKGIDIVELCYSFLEQLDLFNRSWGWFLLSCRLLNINWSILEPSDTIDGTIRAETWETRMIFVGIDSYLE